VYTPPILRRMAALADDDAYRSALRARLLGLPLDDAQAQILEAGRVDAGLRDGCYPWPPEFDVALGYAEVGVSFEPPPPRRPARREQYDPTIDEQIRDAGRVPTRPVRQWRD
jgi:hypothetical protein